MKKMMLKRQLLAVLAVAVTSSPMLIAAVPKSESANDVAIYQSLHELNFKKAKAINFDSDIRNLSALEKSYRKPVPLEVSTPMERVMKTPYRPSSDKQRRK